MVPTWQESTDRKRALFQTQLGGTGGAQSCEICSSAALTASQGLIHPLSSHQSTHLVARVYCHSSLLSSHPLVVDQPRFLPPACPTCPQAFSLLPSCLPPL